MLSVGFPRVIQANLIMEQPFCCDYNLIHFLESHSAVVSLWQSNLGISGRKKGHVFRPHC